MCHLRMAVMHLPTKFCANNSIQFGVIDIFRNPRWRPPPYWIFKSCKFVTFRHVNTVVLELYIKFGSNICYSHWDQHTHAPDVHLMTSRELTSGFDFWSRGHLCMAVMHLPMIFGADIFIQSGVIDLFFLSYLGWHKLHSHASAELGLLHRLAQWATPEKGLV